MATTTEIRDYTATMHIVEDVDALRRRREADNPLYCNAILSYLMCMEGDLLCTANIRNGRNYIRNQMPSWSGGLHHVYMDRTKGFGHQILLVMLLDAADRAIAFASFHRVKF